MNNTEKLTSLAASAGLLATSLIGVGAYAAAPNPTVQSGIEEVLVTARRREENLQDIPVAISAIGAAELASRGVESIQNLNAVVPNLSAMGALGGEGSANFRVRGMPGVAVYIDGVNQPTADGLLTMSVVEVDRIEVLRGPQGTLFGNSSLGGAVHYVTRAPADTFGARVQASVGNYNRRDMKAAIDLPLSDTFKTKFTVASQQRDGFVTSRLSNKSGGDINDELYRVDMLWEPLDQLNFRYSYEKSDTDRFGGARILGEVKPAFSFLAGSLRVNNYAPGQLYANIGQPFSGVTAVSGYPGGNLGERESNVTWPSNGLIIDVDRHTLDADWEINDTFRVRSISGYKELYSYTAQELDGTAWVNVNNREGWVQRYSFSQELQLLGTHDKVDWVLGAFSEQQYNRTRTNARILPEFTCDTWSAADRARRGLTNDAAATCFNLRARAMGVTSLTATGNNIFDGLHTNAQLAPLINRNTNGGLDLSAFGSAALTSDSMVFDRPETLAFFGDLTWRVTDKFSVAAGLRYSEDETDGTIRLTNSAQIVNHAGQFLTGTTPSPLAFTGPLPAPAGASKDNALTKRLNLQYQWTPDVMTYLGYSDGYRPGGVSVLANPTINAYLANIPANLRDVPTVTTRDEQTVKNYEFGLRADWLGGVVRTNLTVFYTDWQNIPLSQYVATMWWDTDGVGGADSMLDVTGDGINDPYFFAAGIQTAVAKAEASGVELEATWRATDALRFGLNVGYLKTEYKDLGQAGLGAAPATSVGAPFAGAPEYTANLNGQYAFNLSGGASLIPRIDYTYTDDYTLIETELAQRIQKGFGLLNARLTYDSGANWTVSAFGTNLTDEWYKNSGIYSRGDEIELTTIGRPREYGLTFDFRFD